MPNNNYPKLPVLRANKLMDLESSPVRLRPSPLSYMLNDLKAAAQKIEPAVEAQLANDIATATAPDYTKLLSMIDDAIEISDNHARPSKGLCAVDLGVVAQHFSEGFSYRFDMAASQSTSIFVRHDLPAVAAYPTELVRIFDTLVRAFRKKSPNGAIEICVQPSKCPTTQPNHCAVTFSFLGPDIGLRAETFPQISHATQIISEPSSLFTLGLELSAGLNLVHRIGGVSTAQVAPGGRNQIDLSFEFPLGLATTSPTVPCAPMDFFFYSKNNISLCDKLTKLAEFHGVKATSLSSPHDLPAKAKLIYDATDYNSTTCAALAKLRAPKDTVIILPVNDLGILRDVAQYGFTQFVDYPLVSVRVVRALMDLDPYIAKPTVTTRSDQKPLRILIVDDMKMSRVGPRNYLEKSGHVVTEANDGMDLVKLIRNGKTFDLILCDLKMPNMDGVTALKVVRNFEKDSGTRMPAILLTTYTELAAEEQATEAGFDQVLRKPLTNKMIAQIITEMEL